MEYHHQVIFSIIIGVAVVLFWRGVEDLTETYLFPKRPTLSAIVRIVIAIILLVIAHKVSAAFFF